MGGRIADQVRRALITAAKVAPVVVAIDASGCELKSTTGDSRASVCPGAFFCPDAGIKDASRDAAPRCGRIGQTNPYGYLCDSNGCLVNAGPPCKACAAPFFCDMNHADPRSPTFGNCTLHCSTTVDCPAISGHCDEGPQSSSCMDGVCVITSCTCPE